MKIADIRTVVVGNPWKNWIFVVVETDQGITGLGEATGGLSTQPTVAEVEEIKHLVIGEDPRNIPKIWGELHLAGFLNISRAMSGIEMAGWYSPCKSLGLPCHATALPPRGLARLVCCALGGCSVGLLI